MKKTLMILLVLIITLSFAGCSKDEVTLTKEEYNALQESVKNDSTENITNTEVVKEDLKNADYSKTEKIAVDFVEAIANEDYVSIRKYLKLEDAPFVSDTSIKSYLIKNGADSFIGENIDITSVEVDETGDRRAFSVNFTVNGNEAKYEHFLSLNDLEWMVQFEDLYLKEWVLNVPYGLTVKVDGIDVSEFRDGKTEYIKIPKVSQDVKTVTASALYGIDATESILPVSDIPKERSITVQATPEYEKEAVDWYINALNQIMESASKQEDISKVIDYFDLDSYTVEGVNAIYKGAMNTHAGLDVKIVKTENYISEEGKPFYSIIVSDDGDVRITQYLHYVWTDRDTKSMVLGNQILLNRTESGFKISSLYESGRVLTWLNQFTNDKK